MLDSQFGKLFRIKVLFLLCMFVLLRAKEGSSHSLITKSFNSEDFRPLKAWGEHRLLPVPDSGLLAVLSSVQLNAWAHWFTPDSIEKHAVFGVCYELLVCISQKFVCWNRASMEWYSEVRSLRGNYTISQEASRWDWCSYLKKKKKKTVKHVLSFSFTLSPSLPLSLPCYYPTPVWA